MEPACITQFSVSTRNEALRARLLDKDWDGVEQITTPVLRTDIDSVITSTSWVVQVVVKNDVLLSAYSATKTIQCTVMWDAVQLCASLCSVVQCSLVLYNIVQ